MPARRYLLWFAAAAASVAVIVYALGPQLSGDPTNVDAVLERKIATALATGHHVALPAGLNEAVLRWDTAELLPTAPEIAVLGSSHSLRISSEMLASRRSMNFSISGGALTDHLITTEILAERQRRPRVWLVFVDAWFFDRSTDYGVWRQREGKLARMETRLDRFAPPALAPIFTSAQTGGALTGKRPGYSLDPLVNAADQRLRQVFLNVTIVENPAAPMSVLRADGALQPSAENHAEDEPTARELAERQLQQNSDRHRYGSYAQIDDELWQLFTRWIQFCQSDGAEVWLVLTPYHPAIYRRIAEHPQNQLRRIELRCREFAQQNGAQLFGSYDPAQTGTNESDFYDGDHLNERGLKRLLTPLSALLSQSAPPS